MSNQLVNKTLRLALLIGAVWISPARGQESDKGTLPAAPAQSDATISSDEMELINNGERTVFSGHVVLTRTPYVLTADKMTRYKDGIVEGEGHIVGSWSQDKGEKTQATGQQARYNPQAQTTELWGHPKLSHWESASDTAPLEVTTQRFIVYHDKRQLHAVDDVKIRRADTFLAQSDRAQFDETTKILSLWCQGQNQTVIDFKDPKGSGHFLSDRARLYVSPKRAQLLDRVTGHIIPVP
jgi:lipopolysaccharide transport protein LptA